MKKWLMILILVISTAAVGCGGKNEGEGTSATEGAITEVQSEEQQAQQETAGQENVVQETSQVEGNTESDTLFAGIVEKYYQAAMEEWQMDKLTEEGMSPVLAYNYRDGSGDIAGYVNYDLNNDGTSELLIGTITGDEYSDLMILDAYALDNGSVKQLFVGGERDRYYMVYDEAGSIVIANEASNSAFSSGFFYSIYDGTGMVPVQGLIYDDSADAENPWRAVYEYTWEMDKGEVISDEDANAIIESHTNNYMPMDYIPVSAGYKM